MTDAEMVEILQIKAESERERLRGMTTGGRDPYLPGVVLSMAADRIAGLSKESGWVCGRSGCDTEATRLFILKKPAYWKAKEMRLVNHPMCEKHAWNDETPMGVGMSFTESELGSPLTSLG